MIISMRDLFEIELPIIQAPMAGVQDHLLAAEVCNAGGLGSLPCAMYGPDEIEREIAALQAKTSRPCQVNFFAHVAPPADEAREAAWKQQLCRFYDELGLDPQTAAGGPGRQPFSHDAADVLERYRPAVVSFHFGLPSETLVARVRSMGSKILSTATTVEEARWLEARGVDAIVVQGSEAGGHRGMFLTEDVATQIPTMDLLRAVLEAVRVPVIAAGGISEAADVRRALDTGACAVQVGTAYLLSPEATTSAVHRAALADREALRTAITNIFTGRPARGIVNRLMRELGPLRSDVPAFPRASAALAPLRAAAERLGRGDFSNMWAGEKAGRCRALPAAEITAELGAGSDLSASGR
jgi:nitronate monooxygenase